MTKLQFLIHKYLPRFFYKKPDGGTESGVTGYFLIEWKPVISIGFLHFRQGSREAYHNHAFNAITWFLSGKVTEEKFFGNKKEYGPSLLPKYTPRHNYHRVISHDNTWCFTIRGPWTDVWCEINGEKITKLTHGRKKILY